MHPLMVVPMKGLTDLAEIHVLMAFKRLEKSTFLSPFHLEKEKLYSLQEHIFLMIDIILCSNPSSGLVRGVICMFYNMGSVNS